MFTPLGRPNDSCAGIVAYEANRPPRPDYYLQVTLAIYFIIIALYSITMPIMWRWRNKSEFYKIRPFELTWFLQLQFILFLTGVFLPVFSDDKVPCWIFLVLNIIPLALMAGVFGLRILAVPIETLYMRAVASQVKTNKLDDNTTNISAVQKQSKKSKLIMVKLLISVLLGWKDIYELQALELMKTKTSYLILAAAFSIPGWIAFIVLLVTIPPYYSGCNCTFFAEVAIANLSVTVGGIFFLIRSVYMSFKISGWDEKGVLMEMLKLFVIVGPIESTGLILIAIDPHQLAYSHVLYWAWSQALSVFLSWYFTILWPLLTQFRIDRIRKTKMGSLKIGTMKIMCQDDPQLKQEFYDYAKDHYILESVYFLDDVQVYRNLFHEKSSAWKVSKFQLLVNKYIRTGSEFEINISHSMREDVLRHYTDIKNPKKLIQALDPVFNEIERVLQAGPWTDFLFSKHSQYKGTQVRPSVLDPRKFDSI